jgi:hypothetical protein
VALVPKPRAREHAFVTSQGSAHSRFTRAIQQRNLWAAKTSLRELGTVSLEDALGYLDLLAEQKPEKLERAAVRWHGRLETESTFLSLAESQLALAALASLCAASGMLCRCAEASHAHAADCCAACALRPPPFRRVVHQNGSARWT